MISPIVSIVIPTKNRYETLIPLVKGILAWNSSNIEILVHDNSDSPEFLEKFEKDQINDPRLTYIYTDAPLSMSENCSNAIIKAQGTFICFLGDDDGVLESVVKLCIWMERHNVDTANFKKASYVWPDLQSKLNNIDSKSGTLVIRSISSNLVLLNPQHELKAFMKKGLHKNYLGPVPYQGICKRNILIKVYDITESCFPSPTPDFSGLVSAGIFSQKHVYVELPLVFSGQSAKSAGGLGRRGKHVGEIADIKSLPKDSAQTWSKQLPHFWSSITVNGDSAIKTLEALKAENYLSALNINLLIASVWLHVGGYRERTMEHVRKLEKQKKFGINRLAFYLGIASLCLEKVNYWFKRTVFETKPIVIEKNCQDINDAVALLNVQIKNKVDVFNL